MKAEVKEVSPVVKQLEVTISAESIGNEIEKFYLDLRKTAKIKGFDLERSHARFWKSFTKSRLKAKSSTNSSATHMKLLLKKKTSCRFLLPSSIPRKSASEKDFTYTARVEVAPALDLKRDYLGIEAEQEKLEVTEEDVNKYLEEIRAYHAQLKAVEEDRRLFGDFVVIDFTGTIEKEP